MQRQWAQTSRSCRKPRSARYSVGSRLRCAFTAATSPQIWLQWMVAQVSSCCCSARRSFSSSGEHMSGAQAEAAMRMRPSALPFHFLMGVFDGPEMALPQRAVELERRGIADRGADTVLGALAQQEAHAGAGQRLGVVVDVVGVLQHQRWCRCAAPRARPAAPWRGARRASCRAAGWATARRRRAACAAARDPRTRRAPGSW